MKDWKHQYSQITLWVSPDNSGDPLLRISCPETHTYMYVFPILDRDGVFSSDNPDFLKKHWREIVATLHLPEMAPFIESLMTQIVRLQEPETRHIENYARLLEANAANSTAKKLGRPLRPTDIWTISEFHLHDYHGPRPPAAEANARKDALEIIEQFAGK